jgi:transcriptional regulator with XRE-family HTH domain
MDEETGMKNDKMTNQELKHWLASLGLAQVELARLIGVTPRAVTLWVSGQRTVPDWCAAYLRVFANLPADRRLQERDRLKGPYMREGLYEIAYRTTESVGRGADRGGGIYDGAYRLNEKQNKVRVALKITFPPDVVTIYGIAHPHEWAIDMTADMDPGVAHGKTVARTSIGRALAAEYTFLRSLPRPA